MTHLVQEKYIILQEIQENNVDVYIELLYILIKYLHRSSISIFHAIITSSHAVLKCKKSSMYCYFQNRILAIVEALL